MDHASILSLAVEAGIDFSARRVWIHEEINEESIGYAMRAMMLMADHSDDPIELWVSSIGGDIDEAFGLHDMIRMLPCPVHTVAIGKICSAAPLLVACGHKGQRWGTPSTVWMLHNVTGGIVEATAADMKGMTDIMQMTVRRYTELLTKYSNKSARFWANKLRAPSDQYFTSDEALEWGLIDQISVAD